MIAVKSRIVMSWVLVVVGLILLIASFVAPPLGVINASVLAAFGEIATFAGALIGINFNYQLKLKEMELQREKKNEEL